HAEPLRGAVELGEEIEARQRRLEDLAQPGTHLSLDEIGAGEKAEPDAQLELVVRGERRLAVGGGERRLVHGITSPPATTMAWPVVPSEPSPHSQSTAAATSSGRTSRPMGFVRASSARASSALRPVLAAMVATERSTSSVSVKPGQTAFTVTPLVASS